MRDVEAIVLVAILSVVAILAFKVSRPRPTFRVPAGLCVVELLGRRRIRGTVRVLWLGSTPWFEVTSAEPGHENEIEGPFGYGAIYRLAPMTEAERQYLDGERERRERRLQAERDEERAAADQRVQVAADAPNYVHATLNLDERTWCGLSSAGLRVSNEQFDCPHCITSNDDIPF